MISKQCAYCGGAFLAKEHRTRFCSLDCSSRAQQNREQITCASCGAIFLATPAEHRRFCSHTCYSRSKKRSITVICEVCETPFDVWPSNVRDAEQRGSAVRYCSKECQRKGQRGPNSPSWRGGDRTAICEVCQCPFTRSRTQTSAMRFCSDACWQSYKTARARYSPCQTCGKRFRDPKGQRFCSEKCFTAWHRGKNNKLWKGGISTENEKIRRIPRYKNWRNAVYDRDDYTCQKCNSSVGSKTEKAGTPTGTPNPRSRLGGF